MTFSYFLFILIHYKLEHTALGSNSEASLDSALSGEIEISLHEALRLLCIASWRTGGLNYKMFDSYKIDFINIYGHDTLRWIYDFQWTYPKLKKKIIQILGSVRRMRTSKSSIWKKFENYSWLTRAKSQVRRTFKRPFYSNESKLCFWFTLESPICKTCTRSLLWELASTSWVVKTSWSSVWWKKSEFRIIGSR